MLIKHVNKNTVDVFLNNGWEEHGRFKLSHKEKNVKCYQVGGNKFTTKEVQQLEKQINE